MTLKGHVLLLATLQLYSANVCLANDENQDSIVEHLVIVANKMPKPMNDVVGTVITINANDINHNLVENFADLFHKIPGVEMESAGNRFANNAINLRGIGGNRVALEVDFSPTTDHFAVGAFANSPRSVPDTDLIKSIEILNGPASTFYGSDAIGGVVSVLTWNPEDLVTKGDSNRFLKARLGFDGKTTSQIASVTSAWQDDNIGALISITSRNGHEINNDSFITTVKDDLDWSHDSYFTKFTYRQENDNLLSLSIEHQDHQSQSINNSLVGVGTQFATTSQLLGDDSLDANRISLQYQYISDNHLFNVNTIRAHYIDGTTQQMTNDFRTSRGVPVRQDRVFDFSQKVQSFEYNSDGELGNHSVVTGLELTQTKTVEIRDALQENLVTGVITTNLLSEQFPLRDFPKSTITEVGVFIQDQVELDPIWSIVSAVRIDHYKMVPKVDALYLQNLTDPQVVTIKETSISPKFGILGNLGDSGSVFLQYAHGFRAPPYDEANIGLEMPLFRIRAIPNPDLKSERSDSIEFGYRLATTNINFNVALYYSQFEDFIESKVNLGVDDTGYTIFQSQNIEKAEIYGFEVGYLVEYPLTSLSDSSLSLSTMLAITRGNNLVSDQPINSISPAQAVIDIGWRTVDSQWRVNLVTTITEAVTRVDETRTELFKPDGYISLDLRCNFQITPETSLNLGVFNLTDKAYWNWQDVRSLANDQSLINSVLRPERSISLSLSTQW